MGKYIRAGEASRLLQVHMRTLYQWEVDGKIKSNKTLGGQRRYEKQMILKLASK